MTASLLAANLTAHWIQAGLVSIVALLALVVLRVKEPRLKLAVLQAVLAVTLFLPGVEPWRTTETVPNVTSPVVITATSTESPSVASVQASSQPSIDRTRLRTRLLLITIAIGIIARLVWIAFGLFYVRRLLGRSRPIDAPDVARPLEAQLGIAGRYVELSTEVGPSTLGIVRPTIALPAGFAALAPGFQRAIICHELVHVKRRDTLVSLAEELLAAVFWFHPLIWLVRHQIHVAREQAVDASVLRLVGDRSEYVRCLVEMSGHDLMPHLSRSGAAMIRTRELQARVNAIFQEVRMSRLRRTMVSIAIVAMMAATSWTAAVYVPLHAMGATSGSRRRPPFVQEPTGALASIAAPKAVTMSRVTARAAQASPRVEAPRKQINGSYAEYPADALEKGISGTVTVNIAINPAGDVSTAGVIDGPQELRASAFKAAMGLKYTPAPSTTATTVYVEYRLDSQSWGIRIADRQSAAGTLAATGRLPVAAEQEPPGVYRVGRDIRAPHKVKDSPPIYPAEALDAKVQGMVLLDVTVDVTGRVTDERVLRSIPLLDHAALDAVKQWEYEPALFNGQPVPVAIVVTVNFTMRNAPRDTIGLNITTPDGQHPALEVVANGGIGTISIPEKFGFAASVDPATSPTAIRVLVFEFHEGDNAPHLLGTVEVTVGGGTVYSTTTPSFGIEAVRREER
jgi:TonB family protein